MTIKLGEQILELIIRTSTDLPRDVENALARSLAAEIPLSPAANAIEAILENVKKARERKVPICQDTGTPNFKVYHGKDRSQTELKKIITDCTIRATELSYLRPNAVDTLTGANSGNNTGKGFPSIAFEETGGDLFVIKLMLKGGGSENVSFQRKLPYKSAGRDLNGIRYAVLEGLQSAQGQGCAPGIIGVCAGGDRASSYAEAKAQLFRNLDDINPDDTLSTLEKDLLSDINSLGIGPMGLGGMTTALGVKVSSLARVPASYFVSCSYMCWACRRRTLTVGKGGVEID